MGAGAQDSQIERTLHIQERRDSGSAGPGTWAGHQRGSPGAVQSLTAMKIVRNVVSLGIAIATLWSAFPAAAQNAERGRPEQYAKLCAACHGETANGGERGPALVDNRALRSRTEKQIHDVIQNGKAGGMPAFALPEDQLQLLARRVRSLNVSAYDLGPSGAV